MKRILFYITLLICFICAFINPSFAESMPIKVTGLNYDTSGALISISTQNPNTEDQDAQPLKCIRLSNPNRVYFDINNAVLIGEKQQIIFEKSVIKELRLAQFETNPYIVRTVVTFDEDFDSSKAELISSGGSIMLVAKSPVISNDYFNVIYDESQDKLPYSGLTASSQVIQKVSIPVETPKSESENTMKEIEKAFEDSTLNNTDGKTYDTVISLDLSSRLKLRTKYYINQYILKNNGLLVSGIGQLTTGRIFWLNSPKRAVIDLPNTYLDKAFRNREISLCADSSCGDTAKIGQFDFNTARIVINSESSEKYIPVYAKDSQSLFIVNTDKLNHIALENESSNLGKAFVKKYDSKSGELILSFTAPVVHSIVRTDNAFNIYFFNVKNYNDQDIASTVINTPFKNISISLLPQIGIKASVKIGKKDSVKVEESVDGKAVKIVLKRESDSEIYEKPVKKTNTKGTTKIVIDPGHGGSDYGAIREGVNEKDITLDISQRVEAILRSKGIKVAMTRTDDTFVSLEDRVAFSEGENPEIFVSIHVNSAVSETPNGIETHWYHDYSKSLAEVVHKHFVKEFPNANDRGLFKSKFYVINHTTCPAILCEIGFLSNPEERNDLITDTRKQKTAKAIADGIIEYIRNGGK